MYRLFIFFFIKKSSAAAIDWNTITHKRNKERNALPIWTFSVSLFTEWINTKKKFKLSWSNEEVEWIRIYKELKNEKNNNCLLYHHPNKFLFFFIFLGRKRRRSATKDFSTCLYKFVSRTYTQFLHTEEVAWVYYWVYKYRL